MADPAVPQLSSVTSESLQATIRRLLPSQQGFGADLAATNVIQPIIDLTPTAEGSSLPTELQLANSFGSMTSFEINNTNIDLANTSGFWEVDSIFTYTSTAQSLEGKICIIRSGVSKNLIRPAIPNTGGNTAGYIVAYKRIIFLASGDILNANSEDANVNISGNVRQVADSNGNLINPVGFTPQ